jgi:hypothetical protein
MGLGDPIFPFQNPIFFLFYSFPFFVDIILSAIGAHDLTSEGQLSNVVIARLGSSIERENLDQVVR